MTIRLKHGMHIIFLFASPDWTFGRLSQELFEILQDRYPKGLTTSIAPPRTTPVPKTMADARFAFAVPKDPEDLSKGWRNLQAKSQHTLADKRLKDQSVVAFTLLDEDDDDGDAEFEVVEPTFDDEEEEEGEEDL